MEQFNQNGTSVWVTTVGQIITSIWVYTIAGVLGAVLYFFDRGFGLSTMLYLVQIVGYVLYIVAIFKFTKLQQCDQDIAATKKISNAYILMIAGIIAGLIPLLGWIADLVLSIIAFVFLLQGYKALSQSPILPELCKAGAGRLYTAMLISLAGVILGIIPLAGSLLQAIVDIIVFVMVLSAWKSIKENGLN